MSAGLSPPVSTSISTVPLPGGAVTVRRVSSTTSSPVPAVPSNSTAVTSDSPSPVSVTRVPPLEGPDSGSTAVTNTR